MDYKELADRLEKRYKANETGSTFVTLCSRRDVLNAATAITDLLARADAEEARVRELETSFRTEKCENGPECVELGRVRKALAEAEARAEKAERERDEFKKKWAEAVNRAFELSKIVDDHGWEE